jgi:hypothetical protein
LVERLLPDGQLPGGQLVRYRNRTERVGRTLERFPPVLFESVHAHSEASRCSVDIGGGAEPDP